MAKIILFHGNTESAIDKIIACKEIPEDLISKGENHYLGDGLYFYNDPIQAEVWAKMKVTRNIKYKGQNWAVLKCEIEYDEDLFMDLDRRVEQDFFFNQIVKLNNQILKNDITLEEYNDAYLCNFLTDTLEVGILTKTFVYKDKRNVFPTLLSSVKAPPYSITRHFRTEKQYVIKVEKLKIENKMFIISFEKIISSQTSKKG